MTNVENEALAIYVAAGRDPVDAIDMINECSNPAVLVLLHSMLTTPGSPKTDRELNDLMVGPVTRRLEALREINR